MARTIWRVTKAKYRATAFSGIGGLLGAGRWHLQGTPIVYASARPELALLETLVHIPKPVEASVLSNVSYVSIPVAFEETIHIVRIEEQQLRRRFPTWNDPFHWLHQTQHMGSAWFEEKASVLLEVPSVVRPGAKNYLINPTHQDFSKLRIGEPEALYIDPRLIR